MAISCVEVSFLSSVSLGMNVVLLPISNPNLRALDHQPKASAKWLY